MYVFYVSRTGGTKHFVGQHLLPALRRYPAVLSGDPEGALSRGPRAVCASSLEELDGALGEMGDREPYLVVFPVYARRDYESGELINTVPREVRGLVERLGYPPVGAVVGGNRTFGPAFGVVNPLELPGVPVLGRFELSGTREEGETAARALQSVALVSDGVSES